LGTEHLTFRLALILFSLLSLVAVAVAAEQVLHLTTSLAVAVAVADFGKDYLLKSYPVKL
jgi:hypothetical protein